MTTYLISESASYNSISVHLVVSPLAHVQSLILDPHEADPMSLVLLVVPLVLEEIGGKLRVSVDFPMKVAATDVS